MEFDDLPNRYESKNSVTKKKLGRTHLQVQDLAASALPAKVRHIVLGALAVKQVVVFDVVLVVVVDIDVDVVRHRFGQVRRGHLVVVVVDVVVDVVHVVREQFSVGPRSEQQVVAAVGAGHGLQRVHQAAHGRTRTPLANGRRKKENKTRAQGDHNSLGDSASDTSTHGAVYVSTDLGRPPPALHTAVPDAHKGDCENSVASFHLFFFKRQQMAASDDRRETGFLVQATGWFVRFFFMQTQRKLIAFNKKNLQNGVVTRNQRETSQRKRTASDLV